MFPQHNLQQLPARIVDIIEPWAQKSPDETALVEPSGSWTYIQLSEAISQTQTWLVGIGVRPGDRVVVVCENSRASVAIFIALGAINAWPVLVSARLSPQEIDAIRDHCGARRSIYTAAISVSAKKQALRDGAILEEIPHLGLLGVGPPNEAVQPEPVDPNVSENIAALIYTSGTMGRPKGVMLTHRNLLFAAMVSSQIRGVTTQDRMYGVLPISHIVGLSVVSLGTLLCGASLYLSARFDPMEVIQILEEKSITIMLGTPTLFSLVVEYAKHKGLKSLDCPSLRIISCSGAPLSPTTKADVEALFGLALHQGYGITECSPSVAQFQIDRPPMDNSVGSVVPGVEVKLVDDEGQDVKEGVEGELWVRGPNVMKGYYRSPEETAASLNAHGWFNSHDLARMENGNLFIIGRTKDMIIRFGFNVYPAEVEAVLNAHPAIRRSAVVGRNVKGEEEVVAFVQFHPNLKVDVKEIARHAAERLATYKRPTQIVIVGDMPLTPIGKIIKNQLLRQLD
jgi:long-chain acyl-CoA synthetase